MYKSLLEKYFKAYNDVLKHNQSKVGSVLTTNPEDFVNILDYKAQQAKKSLSFPAKIQWEITGKCNLKCEHCYIDSQHTSDATTQNLQELSTKECLSLIRELKKNNVILVDVQGGEPFLRKDILIILKEFSRLEFPIRILSNGTLITSNLAEELSKILNPSKDLIQISLDGPNEVINDKIRSQGSFNKIINGLINCRDKNLPVQVNTTLSDINAEFLPDIYKTVSSISRKFSYSFFSLMNVGRGKNLSFSKLPDALEAAIKIKELERSGNYITASGTIGYIMALSGYKDAFRNIFGENRKAFNSSYNP